MELTLREATRADAADVLALCVAAGIEAPHTRAGRSLDDAWQRVQRAGARVLLALDGRRPVGTLLIYVLPLLTHGGGAAAVVESVAVHPDAQGAGIGSALMARAMAIAREAGCYKLALSSNLQREDAHAFYDALGLQRHGISFVAEVGA